MARAAAVASPPPHSAATPLDCLDERAARERLRRRLERRWGRPVTADELSLVAREYASVARVLVRSVARGDSARQGAGDGDVTA